MSIAITQIVTILVGMIVMVVIVAITIPLAKPAQGVPGGRQEQPRLPRLQGVAGCRFVMKKYLSLSLYIYIEI